MTGFAIVLFAVAFVWSVAGWLVVRAWRARVPASADGPARLLAGAAAALDRPEWGRAMTAELTHLDDARERWRFAAGCARAALAPAHGGVPTPVGIATIAAVAGCVALAAHFGLEQPGADLEPVAAMLLVAALAGSLWLAFFPPRLLAARSLAVAVALLVGLGLVAASRAALSSDSGSGIFVYLIVACPLLLGAVGAYAARRSLVAGVQTVVWATVLGTLTVFCVGLAEALHWHGATGLLIFDGEGGRPAGTNLPDFVTGLVVLPLWWAAFGLIGAAAVSPERRATRGR
jgi:hypothetical protein